jgi:hypothetical protein
MGWRSHSDKLLSTTTNYLVWENGKLQSYVRFGSHWLELHNSSEAETIDEYNHHWRSRIQLPSESEMVVFDPFCSKQALKSGTPFMKQQPFMTPCMDTSVTRSRTSGCGKRTAWRWAAGREVQCAPVVNYPVRAGAGIDGGLWREPFTGSQNGIEQVWFGEIVNMAWLPIGRAWRECFVRESVIWP